MVSPKRPSSVLVNKLYRVTEEAYRALSEERGKFWHLRKHSLPY